MYIHETCHVSSDRVQMYVCTTHLYVKICICMSNSLCNNQQQLNIIILLAHNNFIVCYKAFVHKPISVRRTTSTLIENY